MNIKFAPILIFLLFFNILGFSQKEMSFEAGVNLGVASFQTDYGERGDIKSSLTGNIGFALGASFYMNFFDRDVKWNTTADWLAAHIKLKGEISYLKANLEHHLDDASEDLLAMSGTASIVNLGVVVEYHFLDLTKFSVNNNSFLSPFVGVGAMLNFSKPAFESSLGDYLTNPSILPEKYRTDAIFTDSETVFSVLLLAGTRIKAGYNSDIVIDSRWQYFSSNKIDALDPEHFSNKYNDWMYFLSVGYVFYLN